MTAIRNVSAYHFVPLAELKPLRDRLHSLCRSWGLKGTILLSTEGINLFVAGGAAEVAELMATLRAVPGLEPLVGKFSDSDAQPYSRMLVKIKREIIAFGLEGIDPARRPTRKLAAKELKDWLDSGRPITLLDTRNDYEVSLGTFENALAIGIDHFREFPEAARKLPAALKTQPVVMFCTGGIRCEKAGPFLEREGFEQVFQLDGGILKYFEECGGAHFRGECFVFDSRVGVDPALAESERDLCFVCQALLTPEQKQDSRFVEGKSCPQCHRSDAEVQARAMAEHQARLRHLTTPLPGSVPRDNYRPLAVSQAYDGLPLLRFLETIFRHIDPNRWLRQFAAGNIVDGDYRPVSVDRVIRGGERYFHREPLEVEPAVNAAITILHEDAALIVVDKPAPLPVHACGRFHRNTLQAILCEVYAPQKPRPAHRLDANTTGVTIFTRTSTFARLVQPQFERGEVEKVYLARVHGRPPVRFDCDAAIAATCGETGSRMIDEVNGLAARTEFETVCEFADGTSLLKVTPHTGRTNQIRVHLWHLGWPIVGDPLYLPGQRHGDVQTLGIGDPPLCLHAWRLTFTHPINKKRVSFASPDPTWFNS